MNALTFEIGQLNIHRVLEVVPHGTMGGRPKQRYYGRLVECRSGHAIIRPFGKGTHESVFWEYVFDAPERNTAPIKRPAAPAPVTEPKPARPLPTPE